MGARIKRALKWLGAVGLALLLALGAVFASLQTLPGKRLAIRWMGEAVSGPGGSVTLGEVQGVFPFDVRIEHLVLADRKGDWFSIDGFVFRISATQLLRGRFHIREVQARDVRLERLPETEQDEKRPSEPAPWSAMGVPAMPGIRVERIQLDSIHIGAPVLGHAMTFSLGGRLGTSATARSIHGVFQVKRLDGPAAEADLSWTVSGEPAVLSVDLRASEPEEGLTASLLGLAEGGAALLTLKGTAPLEDWNGDLKASVAGLGTLDWRVGWVLDHGVRVRADGVIRPHESYLTKPPLDLLGKEIRIGVEVQLESGEALAVRRGSFSAGEVSLEVTGRLEDKSGAVTSALALTVARLEPFAASGIDLSGSLRVQGSVTGTIDRPRVSLDLAAADGVRVGDVSADEIALNLKGEMKERHVGGSMTWGLEGRGTVTGIKIPDGPKLPDGGPITLGFNAAGLSGGMIEVKGLDLANRDMKLALTGKLDFRNGPMPSFSGKTEGHVRDLSRYSVLLGTDLGGQVTFSADVAVNRGGPLVSAAIRGKVQGFTSSSPIVTDSAAKGLRYKGVLKVTEEGNRMVLSDFDLDSGRIKVIGEGGVDLKADEANGRFQVAIPDLAYLSGPMGATMAGSLTSRIEMRGPLSAPVFDARITMEPIDVEGFKLQKVAANIQTEQLEPDLNGNLTMETVYEGSPLKLSGGFSVSSQAVSFRGISLDGPGVGMAGRLRVDFDGPVLDGAIGGKLEAPGMLTALSGQAFQGKAHVEVSANGGPNGQEMHFSLSAPEVVMDFGKVKGLEGSGRIQDLFGKAAGEAKINLEAFDREALNLKGVVLAAEGDLDAIRFNGTASGYWGQEPFDLTAGGNWAMSSDGSILEMSLLEGHLGGHRVALKGETRLSFFAQGFVLAKTEIGVDKSVISAEGKAVADEVNLDGRFEGIPLEAIRVSGFPELNGSASGTVRIDGRAQQLTAEADLQITGLRPVDKRFDHLPEAAVRGSAQVKNQAFSSQVVVEGISEKPVLATLKAPVTFSLSPPAFSFKEGGAMEGRLDAEMMLETLASYFPSDDQRAKGKLKADVSVSGSADSPRLRGTLELEGGAYDHLGLGLLLRDVGLQMALSDERVEMTTFHATDGEKGTIDAKGQATLGGDESFHFELNGQFHEFKAVRQDEMTITAAGPVAFKGSTESMEVSGDLTLDPVEIRIPDKFPPEVVPLDVIEVRGGKSDLSAEQSKKELSGPLPVTLDLKLKMPERLFLRGRGLDSEWEGRLRIKGPAQKPSVTGNLSVIRGTANVLGKIFRLTSGSVTFDGGFPPSPELEMVAEKKSADMTARIRASGSPAAFNLKLESDPPLPQDEILSRVLFGKSTTQISPFQALTLAQSISELSGRKSLDLFDRTRQMLGFDQLGVTQSEGTEGGTAVSVGKYVSDRVYFQAEKTVTGEGGKVGMEVDVTRNIKLDTEAGADSAEVGVIWQWDY